MHRTNFYVDMLLLACCGQARWRGAAPGKIAATTFFVSVLLTRLALSSCTRPWSSVENGVFAVDFLLIVALIGLSLAAERFWTYG